MRPGGGRKAPRVAPLAERFWAKVDRRGPTECWEWTGAKSHGYGQIRDEVANGSRVLLAHRVALALDGRPVPDALMACHHCDNPGCNNPSHLYVGTAQDNARDCHARKRRSWGVGVGHQRFDEWDIITMRLMSALGFSRTNIGHAFQLSQPIVSVYVRGTSNSWRNVPGADTRRLKRGRAGLTPDIARQIYARSQSRRSGLLGELAAEYGITKSTVALIRDGKTWASATASIKRSAA